MILEKKNAKSSIMYKSYLEKKFYSANYFPDHMANREISAKLV